MNQGKHKKTCEQGKSGKNIEKQEKTRANQGKTQKSCEQGESGENLEKQEKTRRIRAG